MKKAEFKRDRVGCRSEWLERVGDWAVAERTCATALGPCTFGRSKFSQLRLGLLRFGQLRYSAIYGKPCFSTKTLWSFEIRPFEVPPKILILGLIFITCESEQLPKMYQKQSQRNSTSQICFRNSNWHKLCILTSLPCYDQKQPLILYRQLLFRFLKHSCHRPII